LDAQGDSEELAPWFNDPFDCYWFNPNPNWGSLSPAEDDDPSLTRDDTDGTGPELVAMFEPAAGSYRVGVHYWTDHGFGLSDATIRIYILGELTWEKTLLNMKELDLWSAALIHWPEGTVESIWDENGESLVISDYESSLVNPL